MKLTEAFAAEAKTVADIWEEILEDDPIYSDVAYTDNGRIQHVSTGSPVLDLFSMIGSVRAGMDKKNKNISDVSNEFRMAFEYDPVNAIRVLLWARDVRGGAGEREVVRRLLKSIENTHTNVVIRLLPKLVELGRWDDILVFDNERVNKVAYEMLRQAIATGDGLAAKWAPREGSRQLKGVAAKLRQAWGMTPRQYRKFITIVTDVVEQDMSSKDWKAINYEHVPSLASIRYRKAFERNDAKRYAEFNKKVESGEAKVNAAAVYPHQITYQISQQGVTPVLEKMWAELPDYMNGKNILPMVDTSGSMTWCPQAGAENMIHIALGLGLYLSMKTKGKFKDHFVTFNEKPDMRSLSGSLGNRMRDIRYWDVGYNTNFSAAFQLILDTAVKYGVPQEEMPEALVVLSDMEFDEAAGYDSNILVKDEIKQAYARAGYNMPGMIMWNLTPTKRSHVKADDRGFVSVSGFSPSIMKAVLSGDFDTVTPLSMMMDAIGIDRYKWV